MYILMAGLSHKTAPIEIREKFAISNKKIVEAYEYLVADPIIEGVVILDTCNRTEIYTTSRDLEAGTEMLKNFFVEFLEIDLDMVKNYIYLPSCYETIHHLFNVASGIDSMILGETQILGQVKDAINQAMELGYSDGVLNTLFQRSIYVGRKVRNETGIDSNPISVSYAAVELARNIFGSLQDKTVMVVGAGEMSELATKYLMQNGVNSVIVSNRSFEKALQMAASFNGRAVKFDKLADELQRADIVISCTAANHYVIRRDNCQAILKNRNGSQIILIDIAVPRDVDPSLQEIAGVNIYDIDDLQNVVDANYFARRKAAQAANTIIQEEITKFNEWLGSLYVVPIITALKEKGERIKEQELQRALNRLGKVNEHEMKVISSMANSVVNQLLHSPVLMLKEMANSNNGHLYAEVLKDLFTLEVEDTYEEAKDRN